jgi:hypothetical protein
MHDELNPDKKSIRDHNGWRTVEVDGTVIQCNTKRKALTEKRYIAEQTTQQASRQLGRRPASAVQLQARTVAGMPYT